MMIRKAITVAAVAGLAGLAACSSSSSTTRTATHGTETLAATVTGSAAASNLNSNSNAPLDFPDGATWTGLVNTSLKPFSLGSNNANQGTVHWATPAGTSTVFHQNAAGYSNNSQPKVTWVKSGTDCSGSTTFSKGAFQFLPKQSTDQFARLSGTGTYTVTATFTAPLKSGKTTCAFQNIGKIVDNGAEIKFIATAPGTLAPTASPTS